ncbi:MAG TPA: carboxypeptidase-like regulatory domain-containing protein [Ignavibacteriaceae bacterium]|nr:carboxypeptidase-like regulatory domain-containing protein [Ignavibacteriaceae bacterium]
MVILIKIFAIAFLSINILAQGGTIKGKVIDAADSVTLIGANVIILGHNLGAATDINGYYKISNIPPGTYSIRTSFVGYAPTVRENVNVKNSDDLILDFELEDDSTLPSIVILEKSWFEKIIPACTPPWSVDMIPIREIYYLNIVERFKLNPPDVKPVMVEHPIIEN